MHADRGYECPSSGLDQYNAWIEYNSVRNVSEAFGFCKNLFGV